MDRYFKITANDAGANHEVILKEANAFQAVDNVNMNVDFITKVVECNERGQELNTGEKQCNLPVVTPRLFYVVAASQYEEGNLEQITNGLTYEQAIKYKESEFCKSRWPNAYILASLNEG